MSDLGLGPLLRLAGPREPVPEEIEERARAQARAAWRAAVRRRARRRAALAAAASLAVVAAAAALYRAGRTPAGRPRDVARVEVTSGRGPLSVGAVLGAGDLVSTAGERLAVRLSSGVQVRIDQETRLRLISKAAVELIDGGIYVVSAPPGRGIEVRTPRGLVRDVGTRFEVRCLADAVRVRVRDGRASLTAGSSREDIAAGEELLAAADAAPIRRAVSPAASDWDWTAEVAPPFHVEGRPLAEFLAWFSAETGREVRFRDAAVSRKTAVTLHGSVADLTPDEALEAVLPTVGLAARRAGNAVELRHAR